VIIVSTRKRRLDGAHFHSVKAAFARNDPAGKRMVDLL
jgi:hypothetical protein